MTQITAVNLNNLNTFELYKHYAGLSHSLPLLTPESKQLVLAELEQVARLRSEKMDGIHYALTNHEQLITTGKEEKKLLDEHDVTLQCKHCLFFFSWSFVS